MNEPPALTDPVYLAWRQQLQDEFDVDPMQPVRDAMEARLQQMVEQHRTALSRTRPQANPPNHPSPPEGGEGQG